MNDCKIITPKSTIYNLQFGECMEYIVFTITAIVAIIGAAAMLISRNAVHSALFMPLNFSSIAVLYLLLRAPFLFAVQLIVYVGAIIVLFLFVVMLLGAERAEDDADRLAWQRPWRWAWVWCCWPRWCMCSSCAQVQR